MLNVKRIVEAQLCTYYYKFSSSRNNDCISLLSFLVSLLVTLSTNSVKHIRQFIISYDL